MRLTAEPEVVAILDAALRMAVAEDGQYLSSEHVLRAVAAHPTGRDLLWQSGVSPDLFPPPGSREVLEFGRPGLPTSASLCWAIDFAIRKARTANYDTFGVEHLLIGLFAATPSYASSRLADAGAQRSVIEDLERARYPRRRSLRVAVGITVAGLLSALACMGMWIGLRPPAEPPASEGFIHVGLFADTDLSAHEYVQSARLVVTPGDADAYFIVGPDTLATGTDYSRLTASGPLGKAFVTVILADDTTRPIYWSVAGIDDGAMLPQASVLEPSVINPTGDSCGSATYRIVLASNAEQKDPNGPSVVEYQRRRDETLRGEKDWYHRWVEDPDNPSTLRRVSSPTLFVTDESDDDMEL